MEDCSNVCLYVSAPLLESIPFLVHPPPAQDDRSLYKQYYAADNVEINLPNQLYATAGHPSDQRVAFDATRRQHVYADTVTMIGNSSRLSMSPQLSAVPHAAARTSLHFGYSTCHWLKACDDTKDQVGSPCHTTLSGITYYGFCFESSSGTLECGHTTAIDDRLGTHPIAVGRESPNVMPAASNMLNSAAGSSVTVVPDAVYRCERGSPAQTGGWHVGRRLLISGCMLSSDASYDPIAEVHIPEFCTKPMEFRKGCMVRTAQNYDRDAKQSGACAFENLGCTIPTALNYNSEATVADDTLCILPVHGCTIAAETYAGVVNATPGYKSGFYGSVAEGKVSEIVYEGPAVLNYSPHATVNTGCIIAIEGCMESTAVNYDHLATVNSNTWCIAAVPGCMMPPVEAIAGTFAAKRPHRLDGLALPATWDPFATVHNQTACGPVSRTGCMDSTMLNYDPHADIPGACYSLAYGCLNRAAQNFNCSYYVNGPCPGSAYVTSHDKGICHFGETNDVSNSFGNASRTPPEAEDGIRVETIHVATTTLRAAGEIVDYNEVRRASIRQVFATTAAVPASNTTVSITAASVIITVSITFADASAAADGGGAIIYAMRSRETATAALGIEVISIPQVNVGVAYIQVPDDGPSITRDVSGNDVLIAGAAGAFACLLVCLCILRRRRRVRLKVVDASFVNDRRHPKGKVQGDIMSPGSRPIRRAWE